MSPVLAERRWTAEDVSAYLDIPIETLYAWRKNKKGPRAARVGKHLRYDPDEVRAWFKNLLAQGD